MFKRVLLSVIFFHCAAPLDLDYYEHLLASPTGKRPGSQAESQKVDFIAWMCVSAPHRTRGVGAAGAGCSRRVSGRSNV